MAFTSGPAFANETVAYQRIDTNYLHLDDFLNPESTRYGFNRQDLNELMGQQFNYTDFADFTELTGRIESINSIDFYNYEAGLMFRPVKIGTIQAGATPAQVSFTLDTTSYTTTGSIYGSTDRSPLKVNDIIVCTNEVNGLIVSKSGTGAATIYTAIRRDGTSDNLQTALEAHVTGNYQVAIYTTAFSEGSVSPVEGMNQPTIRLKGQMQTFRDIDSITGDADAYKMAIPYMGKTVYADKLRLQQQWRHRIEVNRAMMLSPGGSFLIPGNTPGTGRARLTTGLVPGVRQVGSTFEWNLDTGYTVSDTDALIARAKANHSGASFTVFGGYEHHIGFNKGIKAKIGAGAAAIDYTAFGTSGSARDKAVSLGFNSLTDGGISFHLMESNFFNEPGVTALPGYKYKSMAVFVPGGTQKITTEDNGVKQAIQVPSLRVLHTTSSKGETRRYFTFERGIRLTGEDANKMETFTQQGLQVVNLRNFILAVQA